MTVRPLRPALLIACAAFGVSACQTDDAADADSSSDDLAMSASAARVVEVTAVDYGFRAPDRIPSGWTTFRLINEGEEAHFLLVYRLPEGKTYEDVQRELAPPFDRAMHALNEGVVDRQEAGEMLASDFPDWASSVTYLGGPGLIAAGRTAETALNLEPGTYVIECYVKTPSGEFHSSMGMAQQLDVTEEPSGAHEPEADLRMTLSSRGIEVTGEPVAGRQTIRVHFEEQTVHENFLGHDIHLARVDDGTDLRELATWMDWMEVDGLRAPAPTEFLGGTHEMPAGGTAYFTVDLEPGDYAWIAEVPEPEEKGMLRRFTVR